MKPNYSASLFLSLCALSMATLSPEQKRDAEQKILEECKESTGGTDEDVDIILDRGVPSNNNGKCLLKCSHEKIGIVVDGKFSTDGFKAFGTNEFGDDQKALGILDEMINECEFVADSDACEQSAKISTCLVQAGLRRGIDPKKGIGESIRPI